MGSLIVSVITIALIAALFYMGSNYINIDLYDKKIQEYKIVNDLQSYEMAIDNYKKIFNIYPDENSWNVDLNSLNMILPENKGEYFYSYNEALNKVSICIQKSVQSKDYEVFELIHSKGSTVISTNCFVDNDEVIDTSSFPVTVSLTRWINK